MYIKTSEKSTPGEIQAPLLKGTKVGARAAYQWVSQRYTAVQQGGCCAVGSKQGKNECLKEGAVSPPVYFFHMS